MASSKCLQMLAIYLPYTCYILAKCALSACHHGSHVVELAHDVEEIDVRRSQPLPKSYPSPTQVYAKQKVLVWTWVGLG